MTRSDRPIVFASHSAQAAGGEIAMTRVASAFTRYRPHVILGEEGPIADRLRALGIAVDVIPLPTSLKDARRGESLSQVSQATWRSARAYVTEVAHRLQSLDPLLVHTNSLKAGFLFGAAAKRVRLPVVWHLRDRLSADYLSRPMIAASRSLIRAVSSVAIANSNSTRSTLPAGVPSCVIPSPVGDDPRVRDGGRPSQDEGLTFTVLGRLAPWKGQDLFLQAFAQAFPRGPHRALVVGGALFGEDDYERHLRAEVARLGIADRVHFTGHVEDPGEQLGRTDVLVHSSTIPEPFGLVVVEGMAAGVPVLATDQGGPAETVTHEVDGLLYAMGDEADLVATMRRVAGDAALRDRLGAGGLATSSRFSSGAVAARIERVYDCVTASGRRRARHVVINGRFRTRPLSGVERFAENVAARLEVPSRIRTPLARRLGHGAAGHLWEQLVLPLGVPRHALLWSPCNFGPVAIKRQVVTVHDLAPRDHPEWFSRGYRRWFQLVIPALAARALALTTVSNFTKRRLVDQFDLEPSRVHVITNGCELGPSHSPGAPPTTERSRRYVLAIGAADPRKNVATIQLAMRMVREHHPDVELEIVGATQAGVFASPERRSHPLDVLDGHVADDRLRELYGSAACLVYPSLYEGFGLPPLEAMALGTTVVASRLEPIEEVCGPVAIYVDPSDPADVARGIDAALGETATKRAERRRAGLERAAHYSWWRAAEAFDALFEELWSIPEPVPE